MKDILLRSEFYESINYLRFGAGLLLLIILVLLLSRVYISYSKSPTNRSSFASIFVLFALAIFLIVYTIKSSLALSLGMVGALSIIRFRTAIKEPEQIVYFLVVTAVAISIAAEKEIIAILVSLLFVGIVFIQHLTQDKKAINQFAHLLLSLKIPPDMDSNHIIGQLRGTNNVNKLHFKNLFEDSDGNMRLTFSLPSPETLEKINIKKVLKDNGIDKFSISILDE